MTTLSREQRQEIIRDFCARRNADFDARLFEQEVRERGRSHPAYAWFQWDDAKAATEHRVEQARSFAAGLRVSFTVEEISRTGRISVRAVDAPFIVSPLSSRHNGGGYFVMNPSNPDHMRELCLQGARDLETWLRRYEGALLHARGDVSDIKKQIRTLEAAAGEAEAA